MEKEPENKSRYNLTKEVIENVDLLMSIDHQTIGTIVQCSFVAGMELAMRICRNRALELEEWPIKQYEARICSSLIRNAQVEIGAGRMPRPQFTKEELDEIDHIS